MTSGRWRRSRTDHVRNEPRRSRPRLVGRVDPMQRSGTGTDAGRRGAQNVQARGSAGRRRTPDERHRHRPRVLNRQPDGRQQYSSEVQQRQQPSEPPRAIIQPSDPEKHRKDSRRS